MLEKIEAYYEAEWKDVKETLTNRERYRWAIPHEVVDNAEQRMLGVLYFCLKNDDKLSFCDVEAIYTYYRKQMEELLKGVEK